MPEASDLLAVRAHFGLTQPELAVWLGLHRVQVAHAEAGQRPLPLRAAARLTALTLARLEAPPPPVPPHAPPLRRRLAACRHEMARLTQLLVEARRRAAPLQHRRAALAALRASLPPGPAGEAGRRWLDRLFEGEATDALAAAVGPLPQALLAARLAALTLESELLEAALAG